MPELDRDDLDRIKVRAEVAMFGNYDMVAMASLRDILPLLARLAEVEEQLGQYRVARDNLAAENARLRQEPDDVVGLQARLDTARNNADRLRAELERVRDEREHYRTNAVALEDELADVVAERDAMRPVVDAAIALREARKTLEPLHIDALTPVINLIVAVDSYQQATPEPLSSTQAAEVAEEALGRYRKRREAQEGAQGPDFIASLRMPDLTDEERAAFRIAAGGTWQPATSEDENAGALIPGEGDVPQPVEVAGLDEAVKAARAKFGVVYRDERDVLESVAAAVRAAAPILIQAALQRAVVVLDRCAVNAKLAAQAEVDSPEQIDAIAEWHTYQHVADWLRDRAARQVTS